MRRFRFIAAGLLALMISDAAGLAQSGGGKVYRLGILGVSQTSVDRTRSFTLPELEKAGFVEGRNLVLDSRVGEADALPELARALVEAKSDVIFAISNPAIEAAAKATTLVPIVAFGSDCVGFAASRAQQRNITGVTILSAQLDGKRLELLHESVSSAKRIAALLPPTSSRDASAKALREVATRAGLELVTFDAATPADYARAFADMGKAGAQALVIAASAQFYRDQAQLVSLALDARLPTACEWADMARQGCVIGYGPSQRELRERAADLIARLFHGAAPSTLPIEGPTRFEFAVNPKTARALGLEIPQSVLLRADEVIE